MKKKIIFIALLLILLSCDGSNKGSFSQESANYRLETLTFNGISHEYVYELSQHGGGLCHYPECKFCKRKKVK